MISALGSVLLAFLFACSTLTTVTDTPDALSDEGLARDAPRAHIVMEIGDSITLGAPDGGYRVPLHLARPDLVFVGSLDSFGKHEGWNGYTIAMIRAKVLPTIDGSAPDTTLLMAGANDVRVGTDVPSMLVAYRAFAEELRARPSMRRVIVSNFPSPASAKGPEADAFNAGLPDAFAGATDGISLIDTSSSLIHPTDFQDFAHPNDSGYAKIAARWATELP